MVEHKILVLFGGPSAEHDVSLRSARTVVEALLERASVWPVWIHADGRFAVAKPLPRGSHLQGTWSELCATPAAAAPQVAALAEWADVVFPCVHGRFGEDGVLQGFCQVLGLPCVGSSLAVCALTMDKQRTKDAVRERTSVAMAGSVVHLRSGYEQNPQAERQRVQDLQLPWVVKPVAAGSSVGLTRVDDEAHWTAAVEAALAVNESPGAMVEEYIQGEELTCLVVGTVTQGYRTFPLVSIRPRLADMFDYVSKYQPGGADEICPAPVADSIRDRVQSAALSVCTALETSGAARVDFILRDEQPVLLEVNTMPGFTEESLAPRAAAAAGVSLPELFIELVQLATSDVQRRASTAGTGGS